MISHKKRHPTISQLLFFFLCLITNVFSLDLFFFGKFYNQGQCKSKEEIIKYKMITPDSDKKQDEMIEMALIDEASATSSRFGLFFSNKNKQKLEDAHHFIFNLMTSLNPNERSYFPDAVTCISDIPFFNLFGLFDSYGLIYKLAPTVSEYQKNDLSGANISFLDVVDIYLDIFKATEQMNKIGYFFKIIERADVGVITEPTEANVHIRGKFRRLHNIRAEKRCKPYKIPSYASHLAKFQNFNQQENTTYNINLGDIHCCQVSNLLDLFDLFILRLTEIFRSTKNLNLNFDLCLEDFSDKSDCPIELAPIYTDRKLRREMRNFRQAGLRYQANSVARFIIYVLEKLRVQFLIQTIQQNENAAQQKTSETKRKIDEIHQANNDLQIIEDEEMKLIMEKPQRKLEAERLINEYHATINQRYSQKYSPIFKDKSLNDIAHLRGVGLPNLNSYPDKEELSDYLAKMRHPLRSHSLVHKLKGLLIDQQHEEFNQSDAEKFQQLDEKRREAENKIRRLEQPMITNFEHKKREIKSKFRRLVQKVIAENRQQKMILENKTESIKVVDKVNFQKPASLLQNLVAKNSRNQGETLNTARSQPESSIRSHPIETKQNILKNSSSYDLIDIERKQPNQVILKVKPVEIINEFQQKKKIGKINEQKQDSLILNTGNDSESNKSEHSAINKSESQIREQKTQKQQLKSQIMRDQSLKDLNSSVSSRSHPGYQFNQSASVSGYIQPITGERNFKRHNKNSEKNLSNGSSESSSSYNVETSESTSTSQITDYESSSSSRYNNMKALNELNSSRQMEFERESLNLDGLTLDFDEDGLNAPLIFNFETEVQGVDNYVFDERVEVTDPRLNGMAVHSLMNSEQRDQAIQINNEMRESVNFKASRVAEINQEEREDRQLILDQKLSDTNLDMLYRHELTANLLNTANLVIQNREIKKLEKIHHILSLNAQLMELSTHKQQSDTAKLILNKEAEIELKIKDLVQEFGEGELLSLGETGVTHYTLGDLRDDLSHNELEFISSVPSLKIADSGQNKSITPKSKNSSNLQKFIMKMLI